MDFTFKTYCKLFLATLLGAIIVCTLPVGTALLFYYSPVPWLGIVFSIATMFPSIYALFKFIGNEQIHDWIFNEEDKKQ